ncbi:MAG: hypothetical protein LBL34_01660 [Clostridiales bacterium]|nr:hypothetical protein [Clostridiales bacterium]
MKLFIVIGHYGSGKSEIAANLAIREKCSVLVDLDIVNPYFRTSDVRGELAEFGIKVVASEYAGSNIDIPALPPQINAVFDQKEDAVFDVGGDDDGAVVLGRFADRFLESGYDMLMAVNMKRPSTASIERIIEMRGAIERASGLKVTRIINNTNLLGETTLTDLLAAQKMLEAADLGEVEIAGFSEILDRLPRELAARKFELKKFIKYENGIV